MTAHTNVERRPSPWGSVLLGVGLGAFVDGIVLHQILQWHHIVSHRQSMGTLAGLELNTLADGIFHALAWVFVLAGSLLMLRDWRDDRRSPSLHSHVGLLLVGWGGFNLIDGIVNHLLLKTHRVRDDLGGPVVWDLGFLALSVILMFAGWLLHRRSSTTAGPSRPPSGGEIAT